MADVYRETRVYRDEGSDDDDRYRTTTVRRYKVNPGRYERSVVEVDDDRRSRYSGYTGRPTGELLEVDRRSAVPDRPRSAFEPYGEHSRSVYYERDVERESPREPERSRVSVYEARESDRDWDKRSRHSHSHGHHHHHHRHDSDEIRVEKRVEERYEDPHGHEVERYRKETEYYTQADPPPAPVIIRQRAPEPQKIIVQEAPPPAPIIVPRQDPGVVVVRDKEPAREMVRREPSEEEYWYRHERREVGSHRGDHDRDYGAIGRYDPRYRDRDDEDYYHRRTVIRRERSESPHHKRYLAEGALAAAGLTALLAARRDKDGELQENRGRKVLAGAALGALGTEAVRRAHSAYGDRYRDGSESPDRHSIIKKGLGVAAVALAAAGAAKYYQTNKVEKEESHRGRSRHRGRYSGDEYSRSPTRSRSRSRRRSLSTVAKAALGTAAAAGVVKKLRDRSKSKGSRHHSSSRSRSRSKSRLRRGAEIAGAAAAAGVATKMWKNHKDKDKKDTRDYSSDEDDYRRRRYSHSRSRSRSRSQARSLRTDATADPELGLVEYGNDPLPANRNRSAQGYESEAEARRERRRRRRDRDRSASLSDPERKRSKSRLRDMAAAGAAAIGIKGMKDRHDQDKRDREATDDDARDRGPRDRGSRDRGSRSRDRDRRRYDEDEDERERFYTDHRDRAHSPPTASGGAYYPPYPDNTPPPAGGASLHTFPDPTNHQNYQPYVPQDYTGYAPPGPPPPGPPPGPAPNSAPTAGFPPPPPGPPPAGGRIPPDHVSDIARSHRSRDGGREDGASSRATRASASLGSLGIVTDSPIDGLKPPSQETLSSSDKDRHGGARSVTFIPLSPKSSMTMERHRREQAAAKEAEQSKAQETRKVDDEDEVGSDREQRVVTRPPILRRRSSDPSSDRPLVSRRPARDYDSGVSDSEEDVELLPARFDDYGRPLDGSSTGRNRWSSRHGEFERRPRHPGDWNMRGAWQVSGTEDETVERLARTMTDVLDGRQSWLHLIGGVIGGGLLQPDESHGRHDRSHSRIEDDGDEARQAKHRKRR